MSTIESPEWETQGGVGNLEEAADLQEEFLAAHASSGEQEEQTSIRPVSQSNVGASGSPQIDSSSADHPDWETHGGVRDEAEASDIHREFWSGRPIAIGINGPGIIGRHLIQTITEQKDLKVHAVNDHKNRLDSLARLLRSDSVHGPWHGHTVEVIDGNLWIDKQKITFFAVKDPTAIPWETTPVEVILESARVFNNPEDAKRHIRNPRPYMVILASSPKKTNCPIIVFGVNQELVSDGNHQVISAATCSSNALIPIAAVLEREFRLQELSAITIHAATGENVTSDRLDDDPGKQNILNNIIQEQTGAAKTFFQVFPNLREELSDTFNVEATRVPVDTGSVFIITAHIRKSTTLNEVRGLFRSAAKKGLDGTLLPRIIDFSSDPLTVAKVRGLPFAGIVDESSIKVFGAGRIVKLSVFYDNIAGFTAQMTRLARYVGKRHK